MKGGTFFHRKDASVAPVYSVKRRIPEVLETLISCIVLLMCWLMCLLLCGNLCSSGVSLTLS